MVGKGVRDAPVVMIDMFNAIGVNCEVSQYDDTLYKSMEMGDGEEYDLDFIYMNNNGIYAYNGLKTLSARFSGRPPPAAPILPVGNNGLLFEAIAPYFTPPKKLLITCSAVYYLIVHGTTP